MAALPHACKPISTRHVSSLGRPAATAASPLNLHGSRGKIDAFWSAEGSPSLMRFAHFQLPICTMPLHQRLVPLLWTDGLIDQALCLEIVTAGSH
jgi:hypothetical protein